MRRTEITASFFLALGSSLTVGAEETEGESSAYRFDASYTGELWRNTSGGVRRGTRYLDNLDLQLSVDGSAAWGVPGLSLFAYALYNNGHSVSADLVGDAQAVSNIEAAKQHIRLYEMWAEYALSEAGSSSLRFGLYDLNSEFDSSETASLFINSAHGIGPQLSQTGANGPSIFPVTSLGARLRWSPGPAWALQFAVLDGVPGDPDDPRSGAIRLSSDEGALIVAEATRMGTRLRKVSAGAWAYTASFEPLLTVDDAGSPQRRADNHGVYVLAEGRVWGDPDSERGLDAFARFGVAEGSINRFDEFFGGGLVYTGLRGGRDRLGIALGVPRNGDPYRKALERDGLDTDRREYALEISYRAEFGNGLALQPMVQRIVHPDTDPQRSDALAFALRFEFATGMGFGASGRRD